jgi:mono/diheme cytochrome c family protein
MMFGTHLGGTLVAAAVMLVIGITLVPANSVAADGIPDFTPEYLADPKNFDKGQEVWRARCNFCHGKKAYPGKAPKLKPKKYKPSFVYKRVTKGFRAMPSWKSQLSQEERMAVTAFIMHKRFSP